MMNSYRSNHEMILWCVLFCAICINIVDTKKLLASNIIFRHGHRTPISIFPKSAYQNWPQGLGQLTNQGKMDAFQLGQALNKRYIQDLKFIPSAYNHSQVYFRSSGVDRCLMSAELVASGLFPPSGDQIWNPDMPWQPIPIQTIPKSKDCMLRSLSCKCPARDVLLLSLLKNPKVIEFEEKYKEFFDLLSNLTGETVNVVNAINIYDELLIEKELNMTLPTWVADVTLDTLNITFNFLRNHTVKSPDMVMKKILGGSLLWNIVNNFKPVISSKTINNQSTNTVSNVMVNSIHHIDGSAKLYLYSAHDNTLDSLLNAMGIVIYDKIYYSASILLELYLDDDNSTILELYFRNHNNDFVKLPISNCVDKVGRCSFENFILANENAMVPPTDDICANKNDSQQNATEEWKTIIFISIYVSAIVVIIILIVCCFRQRKGYSLIPEH